MHLITSREHPFFKYLLKLQKSTRRRRVVGQTLLDGIHLIQAYCSVLGTPLQIIVSKSGYEHAEIQQLLKHISNQQAVKVWRVSDVLLSQLSTVKTPVGIMALISIPGLTIAPTIANKEFCILLEAIQDPGNLGSILRSAAAAGASDIYLSINCTDAWSPKTLRAAMGAHFLVTIHEQCDLITEIQQFLGTVIATSLQAKKSLYQVSLTGALAFVFGNEGAGLSDEVLQITDQHVMIPMPGKTESLNASAAVAICLFERVRQIACLNKAR